MSSPSYHPDCQDRVDAWGNKPWDNFVTDDNRAQCGTLWRPEKSFLFHMCPPPPPTCIRITLRGTGLACCSACTDYYELDLRLQAAPLGGIAPTRFTLWESSSPKGAYTLSTLIPHSSPHPTMYAWRGGLPLMLSTRSSLRARASISSTIRPPGTNARPRLATCRQMRGHA